MSRFVDYRTCDCARHRLRDGPRRAMCAARVLARSPAMRFFASRTFFSLWFGLGLAPLALGAVSIGFVANRYFGVFIMAALAAFMWIRARSTCCRCPGFGSFYCGLPSLVAPLLAKRQSAATLSARAIRFHFGLDLVTMMSFNLFYWFTPFFWLSLLWSVVACCIVFIPRRHHGLLSRLHIEPSPHPNRISLPLLATTPIAPAESAPDRAECHCET